MNTSQFADKYIQCELKPTSPLHKLMYALGLVRAVLTFHDCAWLLDVFNIETIEYLLCECNSVDQDRMYLLGNAYQKPEDYNLIDM